jgi:hypothetical protein
MTETIKNLREYTGHFKAMLAVAGFVLAGALLGSALTSAYYRDTLTQEREVTRVMFVDLSKQLKDMADRIDGTAHTQAVAVNKLQDATTTVNEVVDKVDLAATKADKAAKAAVAQAAKVAKEVVKAQPPAPPQTATVQPDVVNREIRKANEKLKERTK